VRETWDDVADCAIVVCMRWSLRRALVVSGACAALLVGLVRIGGGAESTHAVTAPDAIPADIDTQTRLQPPFRLFAAWLDAFNSGDSERYESFLNRDFPFRGAAVNADLELRQRTGGFELRELNGVSATQVHGWVQERRSHELVAFELTLELDLQGVGSATPAAARPYRIAALDLRGGSVPPSFERRP
jgi:hypothetical protein